MRHIGLLFLFRTTIASIAWGQADLPKYYCQGCCGGVGEYYLKLDLDNKFELYYSVVDRAKENSLFGKGTFNIKNDLLTLSFENIPQARVNAIKIKLSDSLIIHFNAFDNVRNDSLALFNVEFKNGKTFFHRRASGTIKIKFEGPQTIKFSSMGFRDINYSLTEPGEYEMNIRLNPDGTTYLKQGDKKVLKLIKANSIEWFQDLSDKKLEFTTKSCGQ